MANLNFNAELVEPTTSSYEILPKGTYVCVAIASEMKPTKQGNGQYLQITFEIIDGNHKGRKIFDRLNIQNQNKVAEDIAQRQLSSLCRAVNVMHLTDSEQLHNIPVLLDIGIEEGKGEYGPQNRIKGYSPTGTASNNSMSANRVVESKPVASNGGTSATPVWKRGK